MTGSVELADRKDSGAVVSLVWHEADNTCEIVVSVGDETIREQVMNEVALDAYRHPGAYLAGMRGLLDPRRRALDNYAAGYAAEEYVGVPDDDEDSPFV